MKHLLYLCLILISLLSLMLTSAEAGIIPTFDNASNINGSNAANRIMALPRDLQIIEEEAFAGTSFEHINLNDKLVLINDYAFAYMNKLRSVFIHAEATNISATAFADNEHFLIFGLTNSNAETIAKNNAQPYVPVNAYKDIDIKVSQCAIQITSSTSRKLIIAVQRYDQDLRIDRRTFSETLVKDKNYLTNKHLYVQSRLFP